MAFIVKFKNRNIEPIVKPVNCSNKIITLYDLQYNVDHIVKVVKSGEVNIYEKIQTYSHDNDFSRLLKNIELTHNMNLYTANQSGYTDATSLPQNISEMLKTVQHAEEVANKLKNDEFVLSKGVPFKEFIKNYSEKEHYDYLKNKYEKKEVKE